jgi:23S rRNA pseudouridine955/2504/2580 synthase
MPSSIAAQARQPASLACVKPCNGWTRQRYRNGYQKRADRMTDPIVVDPPLGGKAQVRTEIVDESGENQRLDNFLVRQLKGVPKSRLYRLLRRGEVRVNGRRATPETRLAIGDAVRIPPVRSAAPRRETGARPAAAVPGLATRCRVHEDDALLVIDKPSGLAVHGGSGVSSGVIELLRQQRPDARFLELVHRLDRDTSGLLMIAKRRAALTALHQALRDSRVRKRYLAIVCGRWRRGQRTLDESLRKTMVGAAERRVRVDESGAHAATVIRPRQTWPDFSLVEAELLTGRTHQIRVHLAHAGFPIVGDDKYGDTEINRRLAKLGARRLMLHAWSLELRHPLEGTPLRLEAPLPPDMQDLIDRLDERAAEQAALRHVAAGPRAGS